MKKSFLAISLTLQLFLSTFAQQPTATPPASPDAEQQKSEAPPKPGRMDDDVVRITTNLVQIDAVVTDKRGKPVTDVRPEEIEIREDGRTQKVTNFIYVPLESSEAAPPAGPPDKLLDRTAPPIPPVRLRPEQIRRTIALAVDDLGLSFESTYFVREGLKKFLDQQMQPDDLVAIIRTGGGIGALQQFTSDKRQLYAAVEKVKWNLSGRGQISAFAPIASDPFGGALADEARDDAPTDRLRDRQSSEDINQFREDLFAAGTLGALNYVVRGLRELPGRKSVVLISDGIKIFNGSSLSRGSRILTALRRLTDLANRASVVIYTIDARGLPVLSLTAADGIGEMTPTQVEQRLSSRRSDFFDSQSGLAYLAQQTGGLAIRNSNDLSGGIRRVLEDQKGYYLIGYRPDDSTFDTVSGRRKFHKLSLKVNRPGKFNVRMRNRFYGITDEEAVPVRRTPIQQLLGALTSPFGAAGVHLRLTSLFANDPKLGSFMRSLLHIRARDLTFTEEPDGSHQSVFEVVAITFGDNGMVIDEIGRTHTIRVKGKTYERILWDGFVYHLFVPLKKPGAYQLRAALRDQASARVGSATQFVEVPEIKKNRLAVSGILIRGISPQAFKKGGSALSNQEQNSEDQGDEMDLTASAAVRHFQRGYVIEYGFSIYNAQIEKASGKPSIQFQVRLFRNGQPVFTGKEIPLDLSNQPDLKRLRVGAAIQLGAEMAPGEYVLQVVVTDLLAKEKRRVVSQWIDFEIVK
ncbi:MAG: VWA domain-containing protein [Pyrinomonadaceae bacterium]|nr:VWA domain-containing protein [Pyrinomonadaceae bacterium]